MATGKKYYWIKLKKDFMTSDTVDFLMGQKNGAQYVVLYQMLCLMCINTNGELSRQIGEVIIPFDIDKIQRDCKFFERDTVVVALELFKKLGLIYEQESGNLVISDFADMVGSETDYAKQKRTQRQLKGCRVDNVHRNVSNLSIQSKSTEKEIRDESLEIRDENLEKDLSEKKESKRKKSETHTQMFQRMISDYSISEPLADKIREWLVYKTERKETYKEQGMKSLLTQISKKTSEHGDFAIIDLIDECMANNWKGIIFERLEKRNGNSYMDKVANRVSEVDEWV